MKNSPMAKSPADSLEINNFSAAATARPEESAPIAMESEARDIALVNVDIY